MSPSTPSLHLPNGVILPGERVDGFLWGGREAGLQWLKHLPHLIDTICREHTIEIESDLPDMRMNLVLFGTSESHGPVVLKLSPYEEVSTEFAMTSYVSGHGYPQVVAADFAAGWLIMERVQPGITLQNLAERHEITDTDATHIASNLMLESHLAAPSDIAFPDLERWLKSLFDYKSVHSQQGPLNPQLVDLALHHADWLINLPVERRLLHGDFHHGNIIQSQTGWMLIDPKGVIAPLAFEAGPWFYNPLDVDKHPNLPDLFSRRLDIFSKNLGIDRVTIWRSVFVACVLSDCWSVEDYGPGRTYQSTIAEALLQLPESTS